jgi:hypothetical protein
MFYGNPRSRMRASRKPNRHLIDRCREMKRLTKEMDDNYYSHRPLFILRKRKKRVGLRE